MILPNSSGTTTLPEYPRYRVRFVIAASKLALRLDGFRCFRTDEPGPPAAAHTQRQVPERRSPAFDNAATVCGAIA